MTSSTIWKKGSTKTHCCTGGVHFSCAFNLCWCVPYVIHDTHDATSVRLSLLLFWTAVQQRCCTVTPLGIVSTALCILYTVYGILYTSTQYFLPLFLTIECCSALLVDSLLVNYCFCFTLFYQLPAFSSTGFNVKHGHRQDRMEARDPGHSTA